MDEIHSHTNMIHYLLNEIKTGDFGVGIQRQINNGVYEMTN